MKEKPESQETPSDENKESLETQQKEQREGTEEHSGHIISEEFQQEVNELISEYKDSMPCLKFMSDAAYSAQNDLREREEASKSKGKKGKVPAEYNMSEAPSY